MGWIRSNGALALGAGATAALLAVAVRAQRIEVHGHSMAPTLLPGDRLVVVPARRLRPGDLVVLPDPREPDRPLVKRVVAIPGGRAGIGDLALHAGPDEVVVLGDNPSASTDSRTLGPLPVRAIEGRVVYRYHPPERAGRLG